MLEGRICKKVRRVEIPRRPETVEKLRLHKLRDCEESEVEAEKD